MAPGEKIKAKIKKNLPVRGPQAPTIKDLMRWYCLNTNTHGCRRIVVSRGRLRRLLWILFTLTAVALIIWQCALLVFSFYTVSVSIKVHFQKLDFPAVTICNINPYKYSAVSDLLTDLDRETKQALQSLYGVKDFSEDTAQKRRDARSTWEGPPPRFLNLIPLLVFNENEKRKAIEFFTGRKRKISGKIIHKASNVMHVHESKKLVGFQLNFTLFHHPMYGNCYTFNNRENATILSTSMGGSEYGLQVILYINEDEYNPFLVSSTGAKVLIHQQNEYPFIEDVGTEIETAMSTSIGMHLTESFKLSEPYSQCTEDGSDVPITNIYNAAYSLQICLYSCFQTKMVDNCGCAQYSQPLPPAANYCNYQQHPNWMYCYYQLYQAFAREELGCQSVCKQACSFKEWTLTTSLAQWPSEASEKWLLNVLTWDRGQQINKKLNKTDLAKLLIFYKDLNQRSIMESPANSIEMLLSNFGGQLGLWMSCSVVCVIEIIEVFFIDFFSIIARHQWQKAKDWWARRRAPPSPETHSSHQGQDNPALDTDDDLPTFTSAMRLPPAPEAPVPGTPPPRYNTLRLDRAFSSQLTDTQLTNES
ncbi:Amiloride-sensitive sodium channel subunit gamma [Lemmus lemmus]